MKTQNILSLFLLLLLGAISCNRSAQEENAGARNAVGSTTMADTTASTTGHGEAHSEETIHLTRQQAAGITLGRFEYQELRAIVSSNGYLRLPPQNQANVSTVMGGIVRSIPVREGEFIRRGQTLVILEHPDYIQLQQDYLEAQSKLTYVAQDLERQRDLQKGNVSSEKTLQLAESNYRVENSRVQALGERLRLIGISPKTVGTGKIQSRIAVPAPIDGYVRSIDVTIGMVTEPGRQMFELVDNRHLHIDLNVYEKDIRKIFIGQQVKFTLANQSHEEMTARVFSIGKSIEEDTKAIKVHAEILNGDATITPGMYVNARIITGAERVRSLPDEAIVREGDLRYIFVEVEEHHEEKKAGASDHAHEEETHNEESHDNGGLELRMIEVRTGASEGGYTEVLPLETIDDDVRVVIKGAFYVLAASKKGEKGSEDSHGH